MAQRLDYIPLIERVDAMAVELERYLRRVGEGEAWDALERCVDWALDIREELVDLEAAARLASGH